MLSDSLFIYAFAHFMGLVAAPVRGLEPKRFIKLVRASIEILDLLSALCVAYITLK